MEGPAPMTIRYLDMVSAISRRKSGLLVGCCSCICGRNSVSAISRRKSGLLVPYHNPLIWLPSTMFAASASCLRREAAAFQRSDRDILLAAVDASAASEFGGTTALASRAARCRTTCAAFTSWSYTDPQEAQRHTNSDVSFGRGCSPQTWHTFVCSEYSDSDTPAAFAARRNSARNSPGAARRA